MNDPDATLVSFVIPMYCTGAGVDPLFEAFRDLGLDGRYELVLVDDGSTDDTRQRVAAAMADFPVPITFVELARNYGEHSAVLEGLRHARGRYVVTLDDDLQNPVREAVRIVHRLRETGADVVFAYYDDKKHHWFRNFGSWVTNRMGSVLLDKPGELYLSTFRGMTADLVGRIVGYRGPYPYVDGLILGATNRIDSLLVAHDERKLGRSGYTLRKLLRLVMNIFFNFSIMPLRLASVLGLVLCVLGAAMFAVVLIEHVVNGVEHPGWGSLMAALSVFSGSQLLILGVVGEYVGRTYMTLAGKPQSTVRTVIRRGP